MNNQSESLVTSTLLLTALYDYKSQTYGLPVAIESELEAKRSLQIQMTRPNSYIAQFPTDFGMFIMGTYSKKDGIIEIYKKPKLVCNAVDFMEDATKALNQQIKDLAQGEVKND